MQGKSLLAVAFSAATLVAGLLSACDAGALDLDDSLEGDGLRPGDGTHKPGDSPVDWGDQISGAPRINEFVFNHFDPEGTAENKRDAKEFVEVRGNPHTDYSTLAVIVVEGDGPAAGRIDFIDKLAATDEHGIWFSGFQTNVFENGSQTLLLVAGLKGATGDDLDVDNDGMFDLTPWGLVIDAVAVRDKDETDITYAGAAVLTPLTPGGAFVVGGASRVPDGVDSDRLDDWRRNHYEGEGLGITGAPSAGPDVAVNTPGKDNHMGTASAR